MPAAGGPAQEHRPGHQSKRLFVSTRETKHICCAGLRVSAKRLQLSAGGKPVSILRSFSPRNLRLTLPRDPQNKEEGRLEISEWLAHLWGAAICPL